MRCRVTLSNTWVQFTRIWSHPRVLARRERRLLDLSAFFSTIWNYSKKHKKIFRFFKFNLLKEDINCANRNSVRDCVQHNFRGFLEYSFLYLYVWITKKKKKTPLEGNAHSLKNVFNYFQGIVLKTQGRRKIAADILIAVRPVWKGQYFYYARKTFTAFEK